MKTVGIIANAYSGKDIRRLVASASVFGDHEKISMLKRILLTLDGLGVERVLLMPDPLGLARRAVLDLRGKLPGLEAAVLELPLVAGDARDSQQAARLMAERGCGCILTLGGDGTNRVVSREIGDVPLLPLSAGTNNVFPYLVEATTAGVAAAAIACGGAGAEECCRRMPLLELFRNGGYVDMALIDAVLVARPLAAARAVWDPADLRVLCLARARPGDIGLSAIGGCLYPLPPDSGLGLYLRTGLAGTRVTAPIAPGLLRTVCIAEYKTFGAGETVVIDAGPGIMALDGEREVPVEADDTIEVKLNPRGPRVVDLDRTLEAAVANGFLEQQ